MSIKVVRVYQKRGLPHIVSVTDDGHVMAEGVNWLTDWPVCYADGRIAYDHPERIPAYVRAMVRQAFRDLGRTVVQ